MGGIALSRNNIPIRLTDERWLHITEEHCELAGLRLEILETIENPSYVFEGNQKALMAVRKVEKEKYLVVVYKELNKDGFIITAFITRKIQILKRRKQLWPN